MEGGRRSAPKTEGAAWKKFTKRSEKAEVRGRSRLAPPEVMREKVAQGIFLRSQLACGVLHFETERPHLEPRLRVVGFQSRDHPPARCTRIMAHVARGMLLGARL